MEINEQKRQKFIDNAGKRVNNVLHDIEILEPMARSNNYDFTKADVEEMFTAMQETLINVKEEFYKKFEMKAKSERKAFVFGQSAVKTDVVEGINENNTVEGVSTNVVENVAENEENSVAENVNDTIESRNDISEADIETNV